MLFTAIPDNGL